VGDINGAEVNALLNKDEAEPPKATLAASGNITVEDGRPSANAVDDEDSAGNPGNPTAAPG